MPRSRSEVRLRRFTVANACAPSQLARRRWATPRIIHQSHWRVLVVLSLGYENESFNGTTRKGECVCHEGNPLRARAAAPPGSFDFRSAVDFTRGAGFAGRSREWYTTNATAPSSSSALGRHGLFPFTRRTHAHRLGTARFSPRRRTLGSHSMHRTRRSQNSSQIAAAYLA